MSASVVLSGSPATVTPVRVYRQYLAANATTASLADANLTASSIVTANLLAPGNPRAAIPASIGTVVITPGVSADIQPAFAAVSAGGYAEIVWTILRY